MKLSEHFSLEEMTRSNTARNRGINNRPTDQEIDNLKKLCSEVLEPIRKKWGKPIIITSGFRNYELNRIVGGSRTSQHLYGQAVDFRTHDGHHYKLFNLIKKMIENGEIKCSQLIWEYGNKSNPNWIHIGLYIGKKLNQILYLGLK